MGSIYGIGNPLMDIIVSGSHEQVSQFGVTAGSMNLVEYERQQYVLRCCPLLSRSPGGSCANTMRGISWLSSAGGSPVAVSYTGAVGEDEEGRRFSEILKEEGVEPRLAYKSAATGSSVIVVTPDYERTMFTHLGACRELGPEDIHSEHARTRSVFHVTGYMWDTPHQERAAKEAIEEARDAGVMVSFDIADPFVVHRYASDLSRWLPGTVDVLFANHEELQALTGMRDEPRSIAQAGLHFAPTVIMKVGADGCFIATGEGVVHLPAEQASPADTTGAGDSFAGGYLYGLVSGLAPRDCGRLANRLAAAIVEVEGCSYAKIDRSAVLAGAL